MSTLWLFNPENDLALAHNTARYTPSPRVARLHERGALLPMWMARPGDLIAAPPSLEPLARWMAARYSLHGELVTPANAGAITSCSPWGWSLDAARQLRQWGAPESALPDLRRLEALRALSHRRTSIALLRALGFPVLPVEASTVEEALSAIDAFGGDAFVKQPWSSSGIGVFQASRYPQAKLIEFLTAFIRKQGSVLVERPWPKARDFAMLFHIDGANARFAGLSVFDASPSGLYKGNSIAPQPELSRILGANPATLTTLAARLCDILPRLLTAPDGTPYRGPAGIDMLLLPPHTSSLPPLPFGRIVPCIEINLRHTMGFVALARAFAR